MTDEHQRFTEKLLAVSEIGTDPVAEVFCLANIDNAPFGVPELVDAGGGAGALQSFSSRAFL